MSRFSINRRAVLRGLGTAISLPLLEAMLPQRAHAATAPLRFAAFWFSNGVVQQGVPGSQYNYWAPLRGASPDDWQLSRTLQPLAPYKADFSVIEGLLNTSQRKDAFAHWVGPTAFLTGRRHVPEGLSLLAPGRSIDHQMADSVKGQTRLHTLTMGAQAVSFAPQGSSRGSGAYLAHISWSAQTRMTPRLDTSKKVFEALCGGGTASEQDQAALLRRAGRLSVLDFVKSDVQRLQKRLGGSDTQRLDEYLTGIRSIEKSISGEGTPDIPIACAPIDQSIYENETYRARVRNMLDLMVLAFQSDSTRVATFMLDNEHNNGSLRDSVSSEAGAHHTISHYKQNNTLNQAVAISRWQVEQLAYLLGKLKSTPDLTGGSVLDNSMILYGTGIGDGDTHRLDRLPIIIAGKGGGRLKPGRLLNFPDQPYANLLAGLLEKWGTPVASWGDGTGSLSDF